MAQTTVTIDSIVRSALMSAGLTIHHYVPAIHHATRILRELDFDVLQRTAMVKLTVDANNEIELPSDFVDIIRIGYEYGQFLIPLVYNSGYTRGLTAIALTDDDGAFTLSGDDLILTTDDDGNRSQLPSGAIDGYFFGRNYGKGSYYFNDYLEFMGKQFGRNKVEDTSFKMILERNKIFIGTDILPGDEILMEYLAWGSASAYSVVHPYAADCIEKYIVWRLREADRRIDRREVMMAKDEWERANKRLRARLNPLNKETLLELMRRRFKQTPRY